jgi:branched-chain amino acid aminotransferase
VIAYVNGEYLPHNEATVSIDDRVVMFGDAVFDATRTFAGRPFRLDDHLERLRRSLRYVELPDDLLIPEVTAASHGVVERNAELIEAEGDVWLDQVVTRGVVADPTDARFRPTVIVKLRLLNFAFFAPFYETGVDLHSSLLAGHFADPMDPRVKGANRLAATRAELKGLRAKRTDAGHWTIVFNSDGALSETHASNLCVVSGDALIRPCSQYALEGIGMATVCELAARVGLTVQERRLTLYDFLNADETLMTASSFSLLPVRSIDGIALRDGRAVYDALLDRWIALVGVDFVEQARVRAGPGAATQA